MGARVGYSWLNGVVMSLLCLSGTVGLLAFFVPIDAGMSILLWIGIVIVSQSFTITPSRHAPAVVIGLLPGIAGWGSLIAKNALRAAGLGTTEHPFTKELIPIFEHLDTYVSGAFALEQGLVFSAMILSSITVYIIEHRFTQAALWSLLAAILSWIGLLHSYQWTVSDTVIQLGWGVGSQWAIGYLFLTMILLYAQYQVKSKNTHS
jgi:AGZA family xanthine/uracil permease-like MFS transporter